MNLRLKLFLNTTFVFILSCGSFAFADCAVNSSGLTGRLSSFANTEEWFETTARDARPLRVVVTSDEEKIFLSFEKSDERIDAAPSSPQFLRRAAAAEYTLWGEGNIRICPNGNNYTLEFLEGAISTSDAPGVMRGNFRTGARLNLALGRSQQANTIQISAGAFWNSTMRASVN